MGKRGRHRADKRVSLLRELPVLGGLALLIALLIKTFLAQAFFIPSGSMENTLQVKDRVIVDKLSPRLGKEIKRGQIVVFKDPGGWLGDDPVPPPKNVVVRSAKRAMVFVGLLPSDSEKDLIKRVIGVPGDRVACCDAQKRITVNGVPLNEPYIFPNNPPSTQTFSVTVPKDRLWVMGDHRSASADSRAHMGEPGGGTIPIDNVIGPAFVVLWPAEHLEVLKVPGTFKLSSEGASPAPASSTTQSDAVTPPGGSTSPGPPAPATPPPTVDPPKPAAGPQGDEPKAKPKPTGRAQPTAKPSAKPTPLPRPRPTADPPAKTDPTASPEPTPTQTPTPPVTPGLVLIPSAVLLRPRRHRGRRVGHHG